MPRIVRSGSLKWLGGALARIDRWVVEVGRNCCAGRSQAALRKVTAPQRRHGR